MSNFRSLYIALSLLLFANYSIAEKIHQIQIEGNSRIENTTIANYLHLNIGDLIDEEKQDKAVKNLYSTSFFEKVSIDFDKGIMTVRVKEFPVITSIEFQGNVKISSSTLKKTILSHSGSTLNNFILNSDIVKIDELYKRQGGFLTKVESKIEPLSNNRAKVIFHITEGPKVEVRKIDFVGNTNFTSAKLKSQIITKEKSLLKFWVQSSYSEDKLEHDQMILQSFYNSLGYADFRVVSINTQISKNKDYFDIIYTVEEGNKYSIGDIEVINNIKEIDSQDLQNLIKIKNKETYNLLRLEYAAQGISNHLENQGYPEVSVTVQTKSKDLKNSTINVVFVVQKAFKAYIDKINIIGNIKTRDKVIRREFKISEGDLFNRNQIDKSKRKLINLDYFVPEKLKIYPTATNKPNKYDLQVEVEEKSTSNIALATGYNTMSGIFAGISYNERNFLGMGKTLDASISGGQKNQLYSLGIVEPHFLDRNMSLGATGFINTINTNKKKKSTTSQQPYSQLTYGFTVDVGYELAEDWYHRVYYSYKYDKLSLGQEDRSKSSKYIVEQEGKVITSAVGHSITYDKTDSGIFPRNGYVVSLSQEYAGLGGQNKYLKNEIDAKYFKSFFKDSYRVKISASGGTIHGMGGKKVRMQDRFNLGDYSFRGFAYRGVGPRDKGGDNSSLGGQKFYVLTAELNFPLGLPEELNLTGNIFADYGALWDFDLKPGSGYLKGGVYNDKSPNLSIGCGILWITRIAPIKIDFAKAIIKKKYDEKQNWHFSFSANL